MRTIPNIVLALCGSTILHGQVISSANLGCTVVAKGGMACNGISAPDHEDKTQPKLYVTHFTIEPGGTLAQPSSSSDCLIIGINEATY